MRTTYFLGAGASAADGIPTMRQLNYGVAAFLLSSRGLQSELLEFFRDVCGVTSRSLARAAGNWWRFVADREIKLGAANPLPNLVETFSVLDLSLEDGRSLGKGSHTGEFSTRRIAVAREELSMALATSIREAASRRRTPTTNALAARLSDGDAVVSTNWDTLVDRAVISLQRKATGKRWLKESWIDYGCVNETQVDYRGEPITNAPSQSISLLKLHGSLNWFSCPSCGELYANVEGFWVVDPKARRPVHDFCHCGGGLENLIVVPSFVKDYRSPHIRSVWQRAQRTLDESDRWVFIGYSLPPDDFHIRVLLLRSSRTRAHRTQRGELRPTLQVTVVTKAANCDPGDTYRDLLRHASIEVVTSGFERWVEE